MYTGELDVYGDIGDIDSNIIIELNKKIAEFPEKTRPKKSRVLNRSLTLEVKKTCFLHMLFIP